MIALMNQFPNQPEKQVTIENWRNAPFNKWGFHHVREILPTSPIPNENQASQQLEFNLVDLSSITVKTNHNEAVTYEDFLTKTHTDALVILKDGKIIEERYNNGMNRKSPHILMSVSKSILGLLSGILIEEKVFEPETLVSKILPEIESTAYKGATVRHLLDMRAGISFDEDYLATSGLMIDYRKATNWNPLAADDVPSDLRSFYKCLKTKDREHGQQFHYVSPNTDLLGWIIERATNRRYSDLLSDLVWKPLGATEPSYITLDRLGAPRAAGGLCTTAVDLALVGQLLLDFGFHGSRQIVPESWLFDIKNNGNRDAWIKGNFADYFPGMNMFYRSKWYVEKGESSEQSNLLFGVGVHGQNLFVDHEKKLVISKFSSQPQPLDIDLIQLTSQWVRALKYFF